MSRTSQITLACFALAVTVYSANVIVGQQSSSNEAIAQAPGGGSSGVTGASSPNAVTGASSPNAVTGASSPNAVGASTTGGATGPSGAGAINGSTNNGTVGSTTITTTTTSNNSNGTTTGTNNGQTNGFTLQSVTADSNNNPVFTFRSADGNILVLPTNSNGLTAGTLANPALPNGLPNTQLPFQNNGVFANGFVGSGGFATGTGGASGGSGGTGGYLQGRVASGPQNTTPAELGLYASSSQVSGHVFTGALGEQTTMYPADYLHRTGSLGPLSQQEAQAWNKMNNNRQVYGPMSLIHGSGAELQPTVVASKDSLVDGIPQRVSGAVVMETADAPLVSTALFEAERERNIAMNQAARRGIASSGMTTTRSGWTRTRSGWSRQQWKSHPVRWSATHH